MKFLGNKKKRDEIRNIMAGLGLAIEETKEVRLRGTGTYSGNPIAISYKDRLLTSDDFNIEFTINGLKKNFTFADSTIVPSVLPEARLLSGDRTIDKHFTITKPKQDIYAIKLDSDDIKFILDNISLFDKILIITEGDTVKIQWANFEKRIISQEEIQKLLDWIVANLMND